MNASIGREKFLAIALIAVACSLTGALIWEWNQAMRLQQELLKLRNIPAVASKSFNILPEFSLPSEEAGFPELISRSMFSVNRRSSAVSSKGGVAAMKKGQFILVGVLITPQSSSVQLRDVQTNKAETVALNGVVRGMTVGEVGPSKVVLRQGGEFEELSLNVQTGPKTTAARAATPIATPATGTPMPARIASGPALPAPAASSSAAPPQPTDVKKP